MAINFKGVNNGSGWVNSPSTSTPVSAGNLNIDEAGIRAACNGLDAINANMVQTDQVNDSTKYPSSKVTYELGKEIDTVHNNQLKLGTFYEIYTVTANTVRSIIITAANLGIPAGSNLLAFWCTVKNDNPSLYSANCGLWNDNSMQGPLYIANSSGAITNIPINIYAIYK